MEISLLSRIRIFMDQFKARPLNEYFLRPINPQQDGMLDYSDIIQKPMDLSTVEQKLNRNQYQNTAEWFSDMTLIYDNAIKYHKQNSVFKTIAEFLLDELIKQATPFKLTESSEWTTLLHKSLKVFQKKIKKSPISASKDDLIESCIRRAKGLPAPSPSLVSEIVSSLQPLIQNNSFRADLLYLVKKAQRDFKIPKDGQTVNFNIDELGPQALNSLVFFAQAYE